MGGGVRGAGVVRKRLTAASRGEDAQAVRALVCAVVALLAPGLKLPNTTNKALDLSLPQASKGAFCRYPGVQLTEAILALGSCDAGRVSR